MKFELNSFHRGISDKELIDDLKRVHGILLEQEESLSSRKYNEFGKFSSATIAARFGTWNKGLIAAGVDPCEEKGVSDDDLFKNIEDIWIALGRQPVSRDLVKGVSRYSSSLYSSRFGSWRRALEAFVIFMQDDDISTAHPDEPTMPELTPQNAKEASSTKKKRTSRSISFRMRFNILMRDGFACQSCGASPAKERGVELHVDHIIPWSKGGETIESNLQTKCKRCNLGKGNAFNK